RKPLLTGRVAVQNMLHCTDGNMNQTAFRPSTILGQLLMSDCQLTTLTTTEVAFDSSAQKRFQNLINRGNLESYNSGTFGTIHKCLLSGSNVVSSKSESKFGNNFPNPFFPNYETITAYRLL